jgi:hypothetical protein
MAQFKKGDLVTKIGSWDRFGTVNVTHYIVSSWGKKRGTLVRVADKSNAKFRVYTGHSSVVKGHRSDLCIQGLHSYVIIPTADYSDDVALEYARMFITHERDRNNARYLRVSQGIWSQDWEDFERGIWLKNLATELTPSVIHRD